MFVWRCVLLNCCQIISDCRTDLEHFIFIFWVKSSKARIFSAEHYHFVLNYFIWLKAWSFSGFWSIYLYIFFQDNVFVTVVTSIQYRALSTIPEHRSTPMSLMVWICNWTLKLKVTMLVLIMKLKESCPLLLNKVLWVCIC